MATVSLLSKKKIIKLGIADFAMPVPQHGSIDIYSGLYKPQEKGIQLHQDLQKQLHKKFTNYESEIFITRRFEKDNYEFILSGRIDGMYQEENSSRIEEIKSAFHLGKLAKILQEDKDHPYCLQLKTYGYLHWLETAKIPLLNFYLLSSRQKKFEVVPVVFDQASVELWFNLRLAELVHDMKNLEKLIKKRKKISSHLKFPFQKLRHQQDELVNTVFSAMQENKPLFLQAPTGLGKTVGVTFPLVKDALNRGQQTIYLTPKNSQHAIAENCISQLSPPKHHIRSITLTSKNKMCFEEEPICNSEYCEFAKNHYTKLAQHNVVAELKKYKKLTTKKLRELAYQYEVCPYQLQFLAAKTVDFVIADYHYVFGYQATPLIPKNLFDAGKNRPNLIIDEVHNLPMRSMDLFSGCISVTEIVSLQPLVMKIKHNFQETALQHIDESIHIIENLSPSAHTKQACRIESPKTIFEEHNTRLQTFLAKYLDNEMIIESFDPVMKLCFLWSNFTNLLSLADKKEFFVTFNPHKSTISIVCCDASSLIKDTYGKFENVVGFSATLKPFDYYLKLSGISELTDLSCVKEFTSPFPSSNRKIIIIPQISTRFNDRIDHYHRIAEVIKRVINIKKGNYFVFFPSYEFLNKVKSYFKDIDCSEILFQSPKMNKDDINKLIEKLCLANQCHLVFALQGGVLAEGIDYPGNMIIGAFIVGPPLPQYHLENEEKRSYYDKQYNQQGLEYTYIYPAMAKAIQSAGRVIRSENDKGLIVFMDNRFLQTAFSNCMPSDWYDSNVSELISRKIIADIESFWLSHNSGSDLTIAK
jgi:DNA excision repair protein ERCC-2